MKNVVYSLVVVFTLFILFTGCEQPPPIAPPGFSLDLQIGQAVDLKIGGHGEVVFIRDGMYFIRIDRRGYQPAVPQYIWVSRGELEIVL